MRYLLLVVLFFSALAQADGNGPNVSKGLPQVEGFVIDESDMTGYDESAPLLFATTYAQIMQEETITRYYKKMLGRNPTDAELSEFFWTVNQWSCDGVLGRWVRAIFNNREFLERLPSRSAQPEYRARVLIYRIYKAALDRTPDRGGYNYYYERLINHRMNEGEFMMQVVGSREFANGVAGWCGY